MDSKPKFSIITICLNAEKTIHQCIESCLLQDFKDYELIVIDGGSSDQTLEILNRFGDSINYLVSEEDEGISHAFNKGINVANGEYLYFLNADDWLVSDALNLILPFILDPIIYTGGVHIWSNDKIVTSSLSQPLLLEKESLVHHAGTIIHYSIFEKIGGFDKRFLYAMDYEFFLRSKKNEIEFKNISLFIANRRLGGISNKNNWKALLETKKIRSQYFSGLTLLLPFLYAVLKNYLGQVLKKIGLLKLYQSYWKNTNQKVFINKNGQE